MARPLIGGSKRLGRQRVALRHEQLQAHEVEPGHQFGDRVLDLEAGVDLEEEELARRRHDELDGAGADVVDGLAGQHRGRAHLAPHASRRRRATAPPR